MQFSEVHFHPLYQHKSSVWPSNKYAKKIHIKKKIRAEKKNKKKYWILQYKVYLNYTI